MSAVIKYFHNGLTGAPVLSGTAGALRAVLDAVLVDGWGTATVDSVTISGGIATVTRSAGHPFEPQTVALMSGATVSGTGTVNGEQTVLTTTASTYTFATTATGAVSGTVQHKFAPLGFARTTPGTNTAAYQITGSGGTGFWLRVDDTGAKVARVVGYESMSDVSTGTNAFPTNAQFSGGAYWGKSTTADGTARPWSILGDSRGFYLMMAGAPGGAFATFGFGDFNSLKSADAYNCFLSAWPGDLTGNSFSTFGPYDLCASYATATGGIYVARPYTGTGSPQSVIRGAVMPGSGLNLLLVQSGSSNFGINYPNAADGALMLSQVNIIEVNSLTLVRGSFPGFLHVVQNCNGVFSHRDIVTGVAGYSGRSFRVWTINGTPLMIDNTGPWR